MSALKPLMLATIFVAATGCEQKPPPPPRVVPESDAPPVAAEAVLDVGTVAKEPADVGLPLPTFMESQNEPVPGVMRFANCSDYDAWVKQALERYHQRRMFSQNFEKPIPPVFAVLPHAVPPQSWVLGGRWVYHTRAKRLTALSLAGERIKLDEVFAGDADLDGATNDFLVAHNVAQYGVGDAVRFFHGTYGTRLYDPEHLTTIGRVYRRSDESLERARMFGVSGELLEVHFDGDAVYLLSADEAHLTVKTAVEAWARTTPAKTPAELTASLTDLSVGGGKRLRPRGSTQSDPRGRDVRTAYMNCEDVWMPNEPRVRTDQLLAVHRLNLETLKIDRSFAIGSEGAIVALAEDRLYVLRRLRGEAGDDGIERAVSQVEIYQLGLEPELLHASLVDGLPLDIRIAKGGGVVATSRWPASETLVYTIDDLAVSDEPMKRTAGSSIAVVSGNVGAVGWKSGLMARSDAVVELEDGLLGLALRDRQIHAELLDSEGNPLATASTAPETSVMSWTPNSLTASGALAVAVTKAVDETGRVRNMLAVRKSDAGLELTLQRVGIDPLAGAIVDGKYVAITESGLVTTEPERGSIVREVRF